MSDSDKLVTTGEAARQLDISDDTARRYFDDGLLGGKRLARHRRVSQASIHALSQALRIPPGDDRDTALENLRRRNRGDSDATSSDPADG